jgi:hypothetical protein
LLSVLARAVENKIAKKVSGSPGLEDSRLAELNLEEKKWVKQVNAVLAKCPSSRIGFYTIGDTSIGLYDRTYQDVIDAADDDLVIALARTGHQFDEHLNFPDNVQGVCG